MTRTPALPFRLALLALAASIAACSSLGVSDDKVDYRSNQTRPKPLDVPPDLSQLARDTRYQPQGGVVSAAAAAGAVPGTTPTAAAAGGGTPAVALNRVGELRIERQGQQRWIVAATATPEQLWPQVRSFLEQRGFTIEREDIKAGVLETNWAENRARLQQDVVRSTIGRVFGGLFDTGLRDKYVVRLERGTAGTEIYLSHRGLQEVYTTQQQENTTWRARPSEPELEAEMLSRLLVSLGGVADTATATAAAAAPAAAPAAATAATAGAAPATPATGPARARLVSGGAALEVDEPFDRAWRRVGLALDRGGFTVEDRDRTMGIYYVRYVDPRNAGKEEPGFWARLFGDNTNPQAALRYRIAVKGTGNQTVVAVLTSSGTADVGENGQRIASLLLNELR